jgi:signal transduction histidine kinase
VIAALRTKEPYRRQGLARRSAPFLALIVLGFVLFLAGSPRHWWYFAAACAVVVIACALAVALPWNRLPAIAAVLPPLLVVLAIALLREGQGGSLSGYGALFLIPTLWMACYGTRVQLVVILVVVVLAFWLPILFVGSPSYPSSQWRSGGLLVLVVGLFSLVIQRLIAGLLDEEARRLAAEQRLREAGAYEIHDDVVQNLTVAQLALAVDDPPRAARAVAEALQVSQQIVGNLLQGRHTSPGGLVRHPQPSEEAGP